MNTPTAGNGDRGFEETLGRLLRIGVLASSSCLAVGLVLTLAGSANWSQSVLLTAGLVALMATPAARVVASAVTYLRRRDWAFAVLTLIVLLELLASALVALSG
jgi:uncharacterized membrane protein